MRRSQSEHWQVEIYSKKSADPSSITSKYFTDDEISKSTIDNIIRWYKITIVKWFSKNC